MLLSVKKNIRITLQWIRYFSIFPGIESNLGPNMAAGRRTNLATTQLNWAVRHLKLGTPDPNLATLHTA